MADLIEFFGGQLAALFALGVGILLGVFTRLLGGIPIIGGALAGVVNDFARNVGWLWNNVFGFGAGINQVQQRHSLEQWSNVQAHQNTHASISKVVNKTIPDAVAGGIGPTNAALAQLDGGVTEFIGQQVAWDGRYGGQIEAVTHTVDVTVPAMIAAGETLTLQRVAALGYVTATDLVNQKTAIEGDIRVAAGAAQAGAVRQVEPQIGAIGSQVGALTGQIATSIAPAIAGVVATTGALTQKLTTVEECTASICESGSGDTLGSLGKLLQDLAPLLEGGILFALLVEAAKDPGGVASDLTGAVGGTVDAAAGEIRSLVGVS